MREFFSFLLDFTGKHSFVFKNFVMKQNSRISKLILSVIFFTVVFLSRVFLLTKFQTQSVGGRVEQDFLLKLKFIKRKIIYGYNSLSCLLDFCYKLVFFFFSSMKVLRGSFFISWVSWRDILVFAVFYSLTQASFFLVNQKWNFRCLGWL